MIYDYEANVLKYVNAAVPSIKEMTYSSKLDVISMFANVTKFPAFYYNRDSVNWDALKVLRFTEGSNKYSIAPFNQTYNGRIAVETQQKAIEVAARIRFYAYKHPYITIKWPTDEETLDVGMRLLYIKVEEERSPEDKKGSMRIVSFQWQSSLFLSIGPDGYDFKDNKNSNIVLTEGIRIYLNADNHALIMNEDNLIKTVI